MTTTAAAESAWKCDTGSNACHQYNLNKFNLLNKIHLISPLLPLTITFATIFWGKFLIFARKNFSTCSLNGWVWCDIHYDKKFGLYTQSRLSRGLKLYGEHYYSAIWNFSYVPTPPHCERENEKKKVIFFVRGSLKAFLCCLHFFFSQLKIHEIVVIEMNFFGDCTCSYWPTDEYLMSAHGDTFYLQQKKRVRRLDLCD